MKLRKPSEIIIKGKTLEQLLDEHAEWLYNMNTIRPIWSDLINADLSYADLEHVNLSRANLHGVNLKNANLTYANLDNVDLSCANFENSDLSYTYLTFANLGSADLEGADLSDADLRWADLSGACLKGANLKDADLRNADLRKANLNWASLWGANMEYANLFFSNLKNADLRYANLGGANLKSVYLKNADLRHTNLKGAEFNYSNLANAFLDGAKGNMIEYRKGKILTEDIIGYKVCNRDAYNIEQLRPIRVIVTLKIPRGAIVFSINGRKCRTNRAKVIAIEGADRAYSTYSNMSYYIGDEFNIYDFNCEYNTECGQGIHFFMTREEALKYLNY